MIIAIEAGRKGSKGFPDKNIYRINDIPMMAYPLIAAKNCKLIDQIYYSTDCDVQKKLAEKYGICIIERPEELATDQALLEDVYVYMFNKIKKSYKLLREFDHIDEETYRRYFQIEFFVLLMANAPCITSRMIEEMILELREWDDADSICTISKYPEFSPYRMRKIKNGYLENWEICSNEITCDRNSGESYYIYDCSCAVVRPHCLENIKEGLLPQRWLGKKIIPYNKYRDVPCLDIDFSWQIGQVEYWLKNN